MSLKARLARAEARFGPRHPDGKTLRQVIVYDDDPAPTARPGEELLIIRVVHTRPPGAKLPHATTTSGQVELEAELAELERKRRELMEDE